MLKRIKMINIIKKKYRFHIFCLLLVVSKPIYAEDLLAVYEIGYCNDPILRIARETFLAAKEAVPQATAQFLPVMKASATHAEFTLGGVPGILLSGNNSNPNNGSFYSNLYNISLSQPVYNFSFWGQLAQARETVKAANFTYAAAEQDLILRSAERYFNVLKAQDNLTYAIAQRTSFRKLLDQTEQKYKAGLIAITDVEIARARHDNALSQEIAATTNLANEKVRLRELTCMTIENFAVLKDQLPLIGPDCEMEDWVAKALTQNLELQAACFTAAAAKTDIKIKRADHLPTIEIVGDYFYADPAPLGRSRFAASEIGLRVSLPIMNGGGTSSKVRQSMHNYQRADDDHERLVRLTDSNTRQAYLNIQTNIDQVGALTQAVVSNEGALKATTESFNSGTRTIVDVLNAETDLIRAKTDLANAKYNYILETLRLKKAAGMLCPVDIAHINSWLVH
jgi:outer membrane protein